MAENIAWESQTAVVAGGTGALGAGVVEALRGRKMRVLTLSRRAGASGGEHIAGDASDEATAARVLDEIQPELVVLCAGVQPLLRPLQLHTWETFSEAWEVDAKSAFVWLRNALLLPMKPGSHIIVVSSAAALQGSPPKRTQWFMAKYAAMEAQQRKMGNVLFSVI